MSRNVTVIIGTGGMGEAIARRIGPGTTLLLADFNADALERLRRTFTDDGFDIVTQPVDVSQRESVAALADRAAELGPVTTVVHTAGLSPQQASVSAILAVDLLGVAISLDEFARVIAPGGAGIVIASMAGSFAAGSLPAEANQALAHTPTEKLMALPFLSPEAVPTPAAAYSLSKRANQLRVQAASIAWAQRKARVNSISPGVISTAMVQEELAGGSGALIRSMVEASSAGRFGTASDIAAAAEFLVGPNATFITGTDLLVDGGVVAGVHAGTVQLGRA